MCYNEAWRICFANEVSLQPTYIRTLFCCHLHHCDKYQSKNLASLLSVRIIPEELSTERDYKRANLPESTRRERWHLREHEETITNRRTEIQTYIQHDRQTCRKTDILTDRHTTHFYSLFTNFIYILFFYTVVVVVAVLPKIHFFPVGMGRNRWRRTIQ